MVKVKFFGVLTNMMPEKNEEGFWITDGKGKTIRELLDSSPLRETSVRYTVYVNNERRDTSFILEDSDTLTVLPLLAGG